MDSAAARFHQMKIGKEISNCLQHIILIYFYMLLFVFKVFFLFMHYYFRVAEVDGVLKEEKE